MTPAVDRWAVFCLVLVAPRGVWDFISWTRDWTHDPMQKKHGVRNTGCNCSVAKSCLTLCNPMDCSTPGSSVLHCLLEFAQTHVRWGGDAINLIILCHPLLLLPSIFPSIRVFSNEPALCIDWFDFPCSPRDSQWLNKNYIKWILN